MIRHLLKHQLLAPITHPSSSKWSSDSSSSSGTWSSGYDSSRSSDLNSTGSGWSSHYGSSRSTDWCSTSLHTTTIPEHGSKTIHHSSATSESTAPTKE